MITNYKMDGMVLQGIAGTKEKYKLSQSEQA